MRVELETFYLELGRRVQRLRLRQGMTQEQLGHLLVPRVTRASITNLEAGKQRVLAHTLVQLAEILEVPLQELVPAREGGKGTPADPRVIEGELAKILSLSQQHVKRIVSRLRQDRKGKQL